MTTLAGSGVITVSQRNPSCGVSPVMIMCYRLRRLATFSYVHGVIRIRLDAINALSMEGLRYEKSDGGFFPHG